tara:strand:- start:294 stop:638 length:345 start_codon:yes stop_codon:yes gene_type:complete
MTFDYSEEEIHSILKSYKHKREKEKERYDRIKDTEEFKLKNRMCAKNHYDNNKDRYKEKYENKKDLIKARNSYYYYKKKNDMEAFKNKYPERYELLLIGGYFKDWKPLESISTS